MVNAGKNHHAVCERHPGSLTSSRFKPTRAIFYRFFEMPFSAIFPNSLLY